VFFDDLDVAKGFSELYCDVYEDVTFGYKLDLSSFFSLFGCVSIGAIAEEANLNPSLLRQYKSWIKRAFVERAYKIGIALHQLGGRELHCIKL